MVVTYIVLLCILLCKKNQIYLQFWHGCGALKKGGYQVLVDDNEQVRNGWHLGSTINANENIIDEFADEGDGISKIHQF